MAQAMFQSITDKGIKPGSNPSQLNYGVAVTDVDGEEGYEIVVAGYDGLEKSHVHKREKQQSLLTIADVLFQYETTQINIQYH